MRPLAAWGWVVLLATATWASLVAPWQIVAALAIVGFTFTKRPGAIAILALSAMAINGALLAWLARPDWDGGLLEGGLAGLRITAVVAINLSAVDNIRVAAWLDGLRLPRQATAFLAAVVLAARDVARDFTSMRDARRLAGTWPTTRRGGWMQATAMMPSLMLASWRRARTRAEALRMAGLDVSSGFAPLVAVTALAIAGRMALIAFPNVALTYVIVFAGGLIFGARIGFAAGFLSMALTNLMLSGLAPLSFVNAPAMGLIGLMGGAFQRVKTSPAVWAAVLGVAGTWIFSITADVATWALIPELRGNVDVLKLRVLAGLAFGVPASIANGVLFATLIGPMQHARALLTSAEQPESRPAPAVLR